MNILIIGNSHVGSLKRAWDNIANSVDDCEIHFIAARWRLLAELKLNDNVFYTNNDQLSKSMAFTLGATRYDMTETPPDVILFYGMRMSLPIDLIKATTEKRFSSAFLDRAKQELFSDWGWQLVSQITRKLNTSNQPVFVSMPLPSSGEADFSDFDRSSYCEIANLVQVFQNRYLNELGLVYALQPYETFNPEQMITFKKFSVGSKRLAIGDAADNASHPVEDYLHMNDDFGELFLRSFIQNVTKQ